MRKVFLATLMVIMMTAATALAANWQQIYTDNDENETRFSLRDDDRLLLNTILGDYLMCNFNYDCSGYGMIPLERAQGI